MPASIVSPSIRWQNYTYQAFGELSGQNGTTENAYRFAGEQFDPNLGEYYLRQRYYDTALGRFMRRDTYEGTLEEPVSLHKYLYANANPVVFTDPSGLITKTQLLTAFKIVDILTTIASPDPLSIALLAAPPGVPAGFAKGLNNVFGSVARGALFSRMAKGVAGGAARIQDPTADLAYGFLGKSGLRPFISDEYLQGLKSFLPARLFNKVVDFVSEGRQGLVLMEAKSKLTYAQIGNSVGAGGKFVGTRQALGEVYSRGGTAFPGLERQVIGATDLSEIPLGRSGRWSRVATGQTGEFQLYQNGNPVMPNGVPVFLQQL